MSCRQILVCFSFLVTCVSPRVGRSCHIFIGSGLMALGSERNKSFWHLGVMFMVCGCHALQCELQFTMSNIHDFTNGVVVPGGHVLWYGWWCSLFSSYTSAICARVRLPCHLPWCGWTFSGFHSVLRCRCHVLWCGWLSSLYTCVNNAIVRVAVSKVLMTPSADPFNLSLLKRQPEPLQPELSTMDPHSLPSSQFFKFLFIF